MKQTIITACFPFLLLTPLMAQDIPGDTVNVTGRHRPIIRDAEKMRLVPQIDDTATVQRKVEIEITPKAFVTKFTPREIKASGLASPDDAPLKKGYARLGFGNYTTPYAELFYNTGRSKSHQSGIHMKHLSSTGTINEYPDAGFSHNKIAAWSNLYLRNHTLRAKLLYDREMVHFYGMRLDSFPAIEFDPKSIRQVYHLPGASLAATNEGAHHKVFYKFKGDYHYLTSTDSLSEHLVKASGAFFGHPDIIRAAKDQEIGLDVEYIFQRTLFDTNILFAGHHLAFNPYFEAAVNEFKFRAGIQVWLESTDTISEFRVFPDLSVSMTLIDKRLILFAGLSGGIKSNNLHDLISENPWISRNLELESSVQKYRLYGGLRASIGRRVDAVIHLELANYNRHPFFVSDTTLTYRNRFRLEYDEDVNVSKVGAEVNFHASSKFSLRARANYFGYGLTNMPVAWHKPAYEAAAGIEYRLGQKIIVSADFLLISPIKAPYYDASGLEQEFDIPMTSDLNIEVDYRFGGGLSLFLIGTNLLSQTQFRYYQYPSQGVRVLGGIAYSM